ncbi:50S ribosomal protein L35ae [Candidatus Woesearchaeota archaeon]|nr:50S ribosomal protein L35ae [Candidatus Woesearchaeota archaeon]
MEATIVNFRGSYRTKKGNHIIIKVNNINTPEKAAKLVGKKITWKTKSGIEIKGEIVKPHGNSGALRTIFEKGLPGQALGTKARVD